MHVCMETVQLFYQEIRQPFCILYFKVYHIQIDLPDETAVENISNNKKTSSDDIEQKNLVLSMARV